MNEDNVAMIMGHPLIKKFFSEKPKYFFLDLENTLEILKAYGMLTLKNVSEHEEIEWTCQIKLNSTDEILVGTGKTAHKSSLYCLMEMLSYIDKQEKELHRTMQNLLENENE